MCKHGEEVILRVPIPANLSWTGCFRWEEKSVDACIASIVQALNDAGVYTSGCCCGHGKENGSIFLHDGRTLVVIAPNTASSRLVEGTGTLPAIAEQTKGDSPA